ncbi:MAG: potassium channel family protein [Acetatifactor sp.]
MNRKDAVVFGLGRFGSSIAMQLELNGWRVLAIDNNQQKVNKISEYVTLAMCADVTNEESMQELGISNFDLAIVSIGHNTEASVLTTILAKDHGVKRIIAKAFNDIQGKILLKIGADEIVFPEKEMGKRIANNLTLSNIADAIELNDEYSIADIPVPASWVGKNLIQLKLREKYQINVIAVKRGKSVLMNPPATDPTQKGDTFVILGANQMIKKLSLKA